MDRPLSNRIACAYGVGDAGGVNTVPDISLAAQEAPRDRVAQRLYRGALLWTWRRLYFGAVRVYGRLPGEPGTLYLSTHRNGGIDGAIAQQAVEESPVPVAASHITRSFWGRWTGCIEVVRATDRERHGHGDAARDPLADALARLAAGESLMWFPEGTSDGGPKLLPVKRGTARLLTAAVERGMPVRVVVMGLHYQAMDALQSQVEVEVAKPANMQPSEVAIIAAEVRTDEIQRRIETALRTLSIEYPDVETQAAIETLTAGLGLPIIRARRALLRVPLPKLQQWSQRVQAASRFPPIQAWPWLLPWIVAASIWLPTLIVAYGITRPADRNNKAFIRSLLAMLLIPFNLALSSWILAMIGLSWLFAAPLAALSLPLGLVAHRHLREARSRTRALRTLRDEIASQGVTDA